MLRRISAKFEQKLPIAVTKIMFILKTSEQ